MQSRGDNLTSKICGRTLIYVAHYSLLVFHYSLFTYEVHLHLTLTLRFNFTSVFKDKLSIVFQ